MSPGSLDGVTFDAVIFDFDGTLADSHAAMVRAYERWAEEFGADLAELPALLGMPSAAVAERLIAEERRAEAEARIEELEVGDAEGVIPLPGAVDALTVLTGRAAIATSCTAPLLDARLAAAGLPRPTVVVTRDQVANGKPAPDSFLRAAELLGAEPARVLVVEDAPAGIAAARAAGMHVLGVLSTKTAEELQADAHVADLSHVTWNVSDKGITVA